MKDNIRIWLFFGVIAGLATIVSPATAEAKARLKTKKAPPRLEEALPPKEYYPDALPMMAAPEPYPKTPAVWTEGFISMEDYLIEALDNYEEGTAQASFQVKDNGEIANCYAYGATPLLNKHTCDLILQRFRYTPALNYSDKPMSSQSYQNIVWRIDFDPDDEYVRTAKKFAIAYKRTINLDIDAKGKVTDCAVSGGAADVSRDGFVCALAREQWVFAPARGDKGKPAASTRSFAPDLPLPPLIVVDQTAPVATAPESLP